MASEMFTAAYLAARLGCSPSIVADAFELWGVEPVQVVNGIAHYPADRLGNVVCYLINSGRAKLDIQIPAEAVEVPADA